MNDRIPGLDPEGAMIVAPGYVPSHPKLGTPLPGAGRGEVRNDLIV